MPRLNRRDVIEALKLEMSIIEGGGYGRSVRTPWRDNTIFRDSVTCLNAGETEKQHPCSECFLIEHVPAECKENDIPCHYIPLNTQGDTIELLQSQGRHEEMEQALLAWIRATIEALEQRPD